MKNSRTLNVIQAPVSQKEFSTSLMTMLISDIDSKWETDIKDCDIATVYKRTLVRNLAVLSGTQKKFCKMTQKMNTKQIWILAVNVANELNIDITPNI